MNLLRSAEGLCLQPACFYPQRILFPHHLLHFYFFLEPIDFSEKKPKTSATSSRSGLSVTFFRSAKYPVYKKARIKKIRPSQSGLSGAKQIFLSVSKGPCNILFF
jgi:hypothetical protein